MSQKKKIIIRPLKREPKIPVRSHIFIDRFYTYINYCFYFEHPKSYRRMDTVLDTVRTGFVRESCTNSNSVPINRSLLDDFKNRLSVLLFIYKPYIISYLRSFFFLSSYHIERVRFCVCTTVNAVTTYNVLYSCSQRQYCQITIFHL